MSDYQRGFQYFGRTPKGVEMALSLDVADMTPKDIADYLAQIDSELSKAGFTRSERLDKPAFQRGGGFQQQRVDDPIPADLVRPEHCGEPMRYVKERPENGDKKAVSAHWDCAKGKGCAQGRTVGDRTFPFTVWDLKKKEGSPATEAPAETNGAMNWTPFWKEATPLGMKQSDAARIIGELGLNRGSMTAADGKRVLDAFKSEQGIAVGE